MITILILSAIASLLLLFKFCTALFFKNNKHFHYHVLVLSFLLLIAFLSIFCLAVLYVRNDEQTVRQKIRLFGNDYAKKIMNFINNLSLVIVLILIINLSLVLVIYSTDEETMLNVIGNFGLYFFVSLVSSLVILMLSPTNTDDPNDSSITTSVLPPAVSETTNALPSTLLPR
jgi:hypothetical protein